MSGIIKFSEAPNNDGLPATQDMLIYLNGAGAIVAGLIMYRWSRLWGWSLGFAMSAAALVLSLASRGHAGMSPGLPAAPLGAAALIADGLFVLLYPYVIMRAALGFVDRSRAANGSGYSCDVSRSDTSQ